MDIELLKKSLNLLNDFPEHIYYINSGAEYLSIYKRCLKDIEQIAQERGSAYIKGKLKESRTLSSKAVDEYISLNRDDDRLLSLFFERIYIENIICLFRTGSFPHSIKKKICKVANINQEIFRVIEKPILETIL